MKLSLHLFFIFFTVPLSAQNKQFTYEYQFISDSTNQKDISKEIMILNVGKERSHYYSLDKYISDSTINAESKKGLMVMPLPYKISEMDIKDLNNKKISFEAKVGDAKYNVEQNVDLKWNLSNEFNKILNYKVQRATTEFGGRTWIAWFAKDIPIQDGPYKFYGLPGLIIKLEDKSQTHVMTLIGNKIVKEAVIQKKNENHAFGPQNEIAVNNQQFTKLWQEHVRDPNKITRQKMLALGNDAQGNSNFSFMDATGKKLDPNEAMRNNEKQFRENLKKSNNKLDLDLYRY